MSQQQVATTLLKYEVTGQQQAVTAAKQVVASYQDIAAAAAQVGLTAEEFAARTGVQISGLSTETQVLADTTVLAADKMATAQTEVAEAYDKVAVSAEAAAAAQEASGSGGGISAGQIAGRIAGVGSIVGSAGGSGFRDVAQIVQLGSTFGVLGVAAGGLALLLKQQADATNAAKDAEVARLSAQQEIAQFISTSTRQQKEDRLSQLKEENTTFLSLQADFVNQRAAIDSQMNPALGFLNNPQLVGQSEALKEKLTELGKVMGANQDDQAALAQAIQFGADTAADAAEKYKQAADLAAVNAALVKEQANYQVEGAQKVLAADQMTAEQRKAQIDLDERQQRLIQQQLGQEGLTSEAHDKLVQQYKALGEEVDYLGKLTDTYADQLEREAAAKQAATDKNTSYLDALAQEGEIRDKITEIEADITTVHQEAATKRESLETDRLEKREEAEAASGEKLAEIAETTRDNIAKIERDAGRSLFRDRGLRDSAQYYLDRQKEADDLEDQAKAQEKQVAQTQKNLEKQECVIDKSAQKQLAAITASENQQVAVKQRAEQQQLVNLVNIQNAEVALSYNHTIGMLNQTDYMYQAIEAASLSWAHRVVDGVQGVFGQLFGNPYTGSGLPPVSGTAALNQVIDQRINLTLTGNRRAY